MSAVLLLTVCSRIEPSYAGTEDSVVAMVGGTEIRESDLAIAAEYDAFNPPRRGRNMRWLAKIIVATNSDRGKVLEKMPPVQQRFGMALKCGKTRFYHADSARVPVGGTVALGTDHQTFIFE